MPHVVRFFRGDHAVGGDGWFLRFRPRRLLENPSDRRGPKMKPGPAERLGDFDFSHARTQRLEPLDGVADEVGKLVDGLSELHQGIGTSSSTRFIQEAIVGAVRRKVSAACWSDQPRAARSSRIAIRSVGG